MSINDIYDVPLPSDIQDWQNARQWIPREDHISTWLCRDDCSPVRWRALTAKIADDRFRGHLPMNGTSTECASALVLNERRRCDILPLGNWTREIDEKIDEKRALVESAFEILIGR